MDDMEREAALTDQVNRSVADEIANDALNVKREKKVGRSYVTDDVAEQARESVKAYNRDLQSVTRTLEDVHGPSNAPFIRSTPGPDDAPAFSASEKSATGSSKDKLVVEEPDVLQVETVKGAPDVTETGVLGESKPDEDKPTPIASEDEEEGKDIDLENVVEKGEEPSLLGATASDAKSDESSVASGDDLKPDKKPPAKKSTSSSKK